ncbi:MAG: hypothetical protein ACJA0V_001988 [Planctomycetota bacterium]
MFRLVWSVAERGEEVLVIGKAGAVEMSDRPIPMLITAMLLPMPMPTLLHATFLLVLATSISAQETARRQPKFVLPAGKYALDELVERTVQARGKPISLDEATRKMLHGHRIVLHHELQLPPQGFADVVATLLLQQGVALVREGEAGELRAEKMSGHGQKFAQFAQPRAVAEVLAHPYRAECVRTLLGVGDLSPALACNFLRPIIGLPSDRWGLQTAVEDGKVVLIGLTDQVAFTIALLQRVSEQVIAAAPALPAWSDAGGAQHRWPGGRMKQSKLLALAAAELGCNLVHGDDPGEDPWFELGKPAQLLASDWFARLGNVLRDQDIMLLPIVAEHRVFQLFDSSSDLQVLPAWQTLFVTLEEAKASKHLLPITIMFRPPVDCSTAVNALLPRMPHRKGLAVGSMGPGHMMLSGPRDYVVEALRLVEGL